MSATRHAQTAAYDRCSFLKGAGALAAGAAALTAAAVSDDRLKAVERQGFERFLETRCADIAEACGLTPRERDIVLRLGRGHSYAYIAGALGVSENTVRPCAQPLSQARHIVA